jgi:hypothetical protein
MPPRRVASIRNTRQPDIHALDVGRRKGSVKFSDTQSKRRSPTFMQGYVFKAQEALRFLFAIRLFCWEDGRQDLLTKPDELAIAQRMLSSGHGSHLR